MLCYHKEYFALGLVSALFIVAILHIFEDVIWGWIGKLKKGIFKNFDAHRTTTGSKDVTFRRCLIYRI